VLVQETVEEETRAEFVDHDGGLRNEAAAGRLHAEQKEGETGVASSSVGPPTFPGDGMPLSDVKFIGYRSLHVSTVAAPIAAAAQTGSGAGGGPPADGSSITPAFGRHTATDTTGLRSVTPAQRRLSWRRSRGDRAGRASSSLPTPVTPTLDSVTSAEQVYMLIDV